MNTTDWNAWLASLPPETRAYAGTILDRLDTIVNEMRNLMLDDLQRVERRQAGLGNRHAEIVQRLDSYEEQRATDVRLEIDRIRSEVITREEHAALMTTIYQLTTRIAKLEPLADLVVRVHALEQRLGELQTELKALERGGDAEQPR